MDKIGQFLSSIETDPSASAVQVRQASELLALNPTQIHVTGVKDSFAAIIRNKSDSVVSHIQDSQKLTTHAGARQWQERNTAAISLGFQSARNFSDALTALTSRTMHLAKRSKL